MGDRPEAVAHAFVRAINRQDAELLAELMTEGHCFVDSLGNRFEGRATMLVGWQGYFRMVPDYNLILDETLSDGPVVVMLGAAQGTYRSPSEKLGAPLKSENRWMTPAVFRAFVEGDKVAEWRVYADNDPMRKLMSKPI